jgi:uncharacterized membrane protein
MLGFEPQYLESCVASCTESDEEPDTCRRTCACMAARMQAEGLWSAILRQTPSVEQEMRYFTLVDECRAAAGS